jgi:hypothetical protein
MAIEATSTPIVQFSTAIDVQECPQHQDPLPIEKTTEPIPLSTKEAALPVEVTNEYAEFNIESPSCRRRARHSVIDDNRSSVEIPWDTMPVSTKNKVSSLRASLKGLASLCKEQASRHDKAAKKHALRNNVLQLASILVTSGATICAAVSIAEATWSGQLIVAILSSSSSATQAVMRLLNPETKKEQHLATEHRYTCLARDIIVKLLSGSVDEHFWESTLKDTQRILDNIEAIAPDV